MDVSLEHIYKDRWLLNHLGTGKPTNFRVVAICTPAWRGVARTTSLPLSDRVKNEDSHEGQKMHALPQKDMVTLDSLMREPHIRRASSRRASIRVIMLGNESEPPPFKAA